MRNFFLLSTLFVLVVVLVLYVTDCNNSAREHANGLPLQVNKSQVGQSIPRRLRVGFLERIASAFSILNRSSSSSVAQTILKRSLGLDFLCAFL